MKDAVSFHNIDRIIRSAVWTFFFFHVFTCGWIRIGVSNSDSWLWTQNIDHHKRVINVEYGFHEIIEESKTVIFKVLMSIYFTSFYFVTVTMTRVGYGDYKPVIPIERYFCMLMALASFTVFGYLIGNERNRKKIIKLQEVLSDARIDVETYIYKINKTDGRKIDPEYYDIVSDFVI